MGVAVVISFVRAVETEIPVGGNFTPTPVATNGCKKGWVYEGYDAHLYVRVMVSVNVRVIFMVM